MIIQLNNKNNNRTSGRWNEMDLWIECERERIDVIDSVVLNNVQDPL